MLGAATIALGAAATLLMRRRRKAVEREQGRTRRK
jgi:hypothetical protein